MTTATDETIDMVLEYLAWSIRVDDNPYASSMWRNEHGLCAMKRQEMAEQNTALWRPSRYWNLTADGSRRVRKAIAQLEVDGHVECVRDARGATRWVRVISDWAIERGRELLADAEGA